MPWFCKTWLFDAQLLLKRFRPLTEFFEELFAHETFQHFAVRAPRKVPVRWLGHFLLLLKYYRAGAKSKACCRTKMQIQKEMSSKRHWLLQPWNFYDNALFLCLNLKVSCSSSIFCKSFENCLAKYIFLHASLNLLQYDFEAFRQRKKSWSFSSQEMQQLSILTQNFLSSRDRSSPSQMIRLAKGDNRIQRLKKGELRRMESELDSSITISVSLQI